MQVQVQLCVRVLVVTKHACLVRTQEIRLENRMQSKIKVVESGQNPADLRCVHARRFGTLESDNPESQRVYLAAD